MIANFDQMGLSAEYLVSFIILLSFILVPIKYMFLKMKKDLKADVKKDLETALQIQTEKVETQIMNFRQELREDVKEAHRRIDASLARIDSAMARIDKMYDILMKRAEK